MWKKILLAVMVLPLLLGLFLWQVQPAAGIWSSERSADLSGADPDKLRWLYRLRLYSESWALPQGLPGNGVRQCRLL